MVDEKLDELASDTLRLEDGLAEIRRRMAEAKLARTPAPKVTEVRVMWIDRILRFRSRGER